MIINFSVKNFGCIKDEVTLSFEANKSDDLEDYYIIEPKKGLRLLKLGLIFGPNASGKTTVLRALDFLRKIVLDSPSQKTTTFDSRFFDYQPFLFSENTKTQDSTFTLEFFQNNIKYLYKVELNKNAVVNETLDFYNPRKANVYKRKSDIDKSLSKIEFGSKIKVSKESKSVLEANTLINNTVLGGYLKTNVDSHELNEAVNWFEKNLISLTVPSKDLTNFIYEKIQEEEITTIGILAYLKKADFKISNLSFKNKKYLFGEREEFGKLLNLVSTKINHVTDLVPDKDGMINRQISFTHSIDEGKEYSLNYRDESQGTQRYYQFSGLLDLMIQNHRIVPIDELESSLHPDLLEHFLLTFLVNSKNSQLIATTHRRELLMKKDILRPDAIWFTEKKSDGGTDLYSLDDFDTSVIRPDTGSIYNAYKIGKLGATPNLGDYYIDLEDGKA